MNISAPLADYILNHGGDDPDRIRLAGKEIHGYSAGFVADQIEARQRYKRRFPALCTDPKIIFPPKMNLEQSSSEATAMLKAEFMAGQTGNVNRVIDLTTGFGVDALAMSRIADELILVEPDEKLRLIAAANFNRLIPGKTVWSDLPAEEFLARYNDHANWIYADPSRRQSGNKVYQLEDSSPDPVALTEDMLRIAENVLIKTSPMLDISVVRKHWNSIQNILIVSVSNECREILYHLTGKPNPDPQITCINLKSEEKEEFVFHQTADHSAKVSYANPMKFIFEPNASVLKAGAFKLTAERFGLYKLAAHTHLYTSDIAILNFPGRIFEVIRPIQKSDSEIKANIISRNHPMTSNQIAKKFKVVDGGDDFIIAFSGQAEKFILLTRRFKKP